MEKYNEEIERLIRFFLLGECTAEEQEELKKWCARNDENRLFFETMCQSEKVAEEYPLYERIDEERALRKFEQSVAEERQRLFRKYYSWWKYAAVVLLFLGSVLVWQWKGQEPGRLSGNDAACVISPGSSKATLILGTGERITLQDNFNAEIPVKEDVKAVHQHDRLVYYSSVAAVEKEVYNTLEIPRGGEYKLILADGTKVFLNSATTFKYPVAFTGKERRVYLSGEAYFEVEKDETHPFLVEAAGTEISVYGTSFNVNTFEEVHTVLVEGSVGLKLLETGKKIKIRPGQLAISKREGGIEVREVETGLYTDWKDGIFRFEGRRLEDIMNTLSNWYAVEVFYQSPEVKELHFSGFMERYKEINFILEAIHEATGVKFAISGKTITISE